MNERSIPPAYYDNILRNGTMFNVHTRKCNGAIYASDMASDMDNDPKRSYRICSHGAGSGILSGHRSMLAFCREICRAHRSMSVLLPGIHRDHRFMDHFYHGVQWDKGSMP